MDKGNVHQTITFKFDSGKAPVTDATKALEKNVVEAANLAGIAKEVTGGAYVGAVHDSKGDPTMRLSVRLEAGSGEASKGEKGYLTSAHAYVDDKGKPTQDGIVRFSDPKVQTRYEDALIQHGQYEKYRAEQKHVAERLSPAERVKYQKAQTQREKAEKIYALEEKAGEKKE